MALTYAHKYLKNCLHTLETSTCAIQTNINIPAAITYNVLLLLGYDMIYLLTAIGLPPGGSSTVHIYT